MIAGPKYNLFVKNLTPRFRKIPCEEKRGFYEIPLLNATTFNIIYLTPFNQFLHALPLNVLGSFRILTKKNALIKVE
jgi:hypothetical protein